MSSPSIPIPIASDAAAMRELLIRCLVMGIGLVLNSSLVYITYREKSLRTQCNFLIALESVFCIIYDLNGFSTLAIAIFGPGFVNVRICCLLIQPIPTVAAWCYFTTIFLIALDRVSSILFPIWYFRLAKSHSFLYYFLHLSVCLLASVYNFQGKYRWVMEDGQKDLNVVCYLNDCNGAYNVQISFGQLMATNACTVLAYSILWIIIRLKKADTAESKLNLRDTRKLFKPLAILAILYTIGTIVSLFRLFLPYIPLMPNDMRILVFLLSMTGLIPQLITMPILIIYSSIYRRAFKKYWLQLFNGINNLNNEIMVISLPQQNRNRTNILPIVE